jgi:hypothetical protein
MWGLLTYTPPAGGYAYLLSLIGAMASPLVGTLRSITELQKYCDWRRLYHPRGTLMQPDEVRTAWAELQANPRRVYAY